MRTGGKYIQETTSKMREKFRKPLALAVPRRVVGRLKCGQTNVYLQMQNKFATRTNCVFLVQDSAQVLAQKASHTIPKSTQIKSYI